MEQFDVATLDRSNGVEHRVKECYERNKKLIDPTQQPPEEIKTKVFAEILQAQNPKKVDPSWHTFYEVVPSMV